MILTDSEVGSVKVALHCWELLGYASTAIVFAGCVGEYIAEFTSLPRTELAVKKLARLSLSVLIFGISGELLSAVRASQSSGLLIANIEQNAEETNERASANEKASGDAILKAGTADKEANEAKERTAKLEKDAAELQLENTRLLELVQPRTLTIEQQKAIGDAVKQYVGKFVMIRASLADQEAVQLGQLIVNSLRIGGVNAFSFLAVSGLANPPIGVRAIGPDEELVDAINNVLRDRGKLALIPATWKPIEVGFVAKPTLPRPTDADIWVGAKPLPSQDKYQIQQMIQHR